MDGHHLQTLGTCAVLLAALGGVAHAQAFSSGSDGSDGALNIVGGQGTIDFNVVSMSQRADSQPLDPDGDGVFHFTTITVGAGTTVRLRANMQGFAAGKPVIWLATGNATISGTLDLRGNGGAGGGTFPFAAVPGAGGFHGGAGALDGNTADFPQPGQGPGGGGADPTKAFGGWAAHRTVHGADSNTAASGTPYGNAFLLPLLGGSGGGGSRGSGSSSGGGGGAGGGAILIASSTLITLPSGGRIEALGGNGGASSRARGSGGAIRLMAPTIAGGGQLDVRDHFGSSNSSGWIRLEAYEYLNPLPTFQPVGAQSIRKSLPDPSIVLPAAKPQIRVSKLVTPTGDVLVPVAPTGSFTPPDVTINTPNPITLHLEAQNIPPGAATTITITIVSEDNPAITILAGSLSGTLTTSTTTAGPVVIPSGLARFYVTARWTTQ